MPVTTTNTLLLAFFDSLGESVSPTANFVPPASAPLSNLRSSDLYLETRTPDLTTDRQLTWDFDTLIEANVFALLGSNATLSYLRRFRAATDSLFTSIVAESGGGLTAGFDTSLGQSRAVYTPPWGRVLAYVHPVSFISRYIRWHQSDATNPQGYQKWGAARLGLGVQYPYSEWSTDPKPAGTPGSEKVLRGHQFTLHNLTESQAYELESISLSVKTSRRVLIIPHALKPASFLNDAIWGTLEEFVARSYISRSSDRYRGVLKVREVDR